MRARITRVFSFCVALAACLSLNFNQAHVASAVPQATSSGKVSYRPFSALRSEANYLAGKATPRKVENRMIAVRSDGSVAETWYRRDPASTGEHPRKIQDLRTGLHIVVEPLGKSVTTYPLEPEIIKSLSAGANSTCEGVSSGLVLGYEVLVSESTNSPSSELSFKKKIWRAPALNCFALMEEVIRIADGKETETLISTVISVTEGEPEPSLFQPPSNYTERGPSEAMSEGLRQLPQGTCTTCAKSSNPIVFDATKDRIYREARARAEARGQRFE